MMQKLSRTTLIVALAGGLALAAYASLQLPSEPNIQLPAEPAVHAASIRDLFR